jgi:hypothetical protein
MSKLVLSAANRAKVAHKLPPSVVVETRPAEPKEPAPDEIGGDRQAAVLKLEALLRERFPAVFCASPRVPLAVGIFRQIREVAGDEIDPKGLGRFMQWWTSRWDYVAAIARGEMRRNLDGSSAAAPSEDQQQDAARKLDAARERFGPWVDKVAAHHVGDEG